MASLYKWVYGNGELHLSPRLNSVFENPHHRDLMSNAGISFGDKYFIKDLAAGTYDPVTDSFSFYAEGSEAPSKEDLHTLIRNELMPHADHTGGYFFETQKVADNNGYVTLNESGNLVPCKGTWFMSWVYDAATKKVYKCANHYEVLELIPDWHNKGMEGLILCGWYGGGYNNNEEYVVGYVVGTRINSDSVSGSYINDKSPLVDEALRASLNAYRKDQYANDELSSRPTASIERASIELKDGRIFYGTHHMEVLKNLTEQGIPINEIKEFAGGDMPYHWNHVLEYYPQSLPQVKGSGEPDERCWATLKDGRTLYGLTHWDIIKNLEEKNIDLSEVKSFGGGDCAGNWNRMLQYRQSNIDPTEKHFYGGSWVYDSTDGKIYRGNNHIDIIPYIPDGWDKAGKNELLCGWGGINNNGTPRASIATDTVDQELANPRSPLAAKGISAAISDYIQRPELSLEELCIPEDQKAVAGEYH